MTAISRHFGLAEEMWSARLCPKGAQRRSGIHSREAN